MSYTKGPWTFDTSIENDVYLGQILAPSRAIVSIFRHYDRKGKREQLQEDLANAALIAAAPEMFEALEEALYSIKALDEDYDIRPSYINGMQALTKAKGGQL